MPSGKAASQAGHAFLDTYLTAPATLRAAYHADGMGTKIVLIAADEVALRALHERAISLQIPSALITDSNHVMPPHFDGSPIVTALGLGPAARDQALPITEGLKLMP